MNVPGSCYSASSGFLHLSPELFEHRTCAFEQLTKNDFHWLEHFTSSNLLHDVFRLEVCGTAEKADAEIILCGPEEALPDWPNGSKS